MKATFTTNEKGVELAFNGLLTICPKTEFEPVYSLGFNRLMKIASKKRLQFELSLIKSGKATINTSNDIFKSILQNMTESEYKQFKKSL